MEKNIMPEFHLFPRIERVGHVISRLVHFLPETPLASHGDHLPSERGAEAMLYEQLQLKYDSEGTYMDKDGNWQ